MPLAWGLIKTGTCLEGDLRLSLGFNRDYAFENKAELSARMEVLRADRSSRPLDESHDDFDIARVRHFDSLKLSKAGGRAR